MLYNFINLHRRAILDRARSKIELRAAPVATPTELTNGIPLFLQQLTDSLRRALENADTDAIVASAARHGGDLQRMGFTVTQVVHDYGDICQAVTELAEEFDTIISIDEFHTLNKCLDDAIAGAVTEYSRVREVGQRTDNSLRLAELAHELRNKLSAATLAHMAIKSGAVGIGGSTGAVLDRNLRGMRDLIDGALAAARIESGQLHRDRVNVSELLEEIEADATLEAKERGVTFAIIAEAGPHSVTVDRAIIVAAVINLLHNAFKFSKLGGHISLTASAAGGRVLLAVQDQCGGLPAGDPQDLFGSFMQRDANRNGVGLGLSISRKGVESNGGTIRVADLKGHGCIFTIDLPSAALTLAAA